MGVYIKGMEMPDKCGSCPCFHAEHPIHCQAVKADKAKRIAAPYGLPRPDWCPLANVPPHGRLIDADKLHEAMYHRAFETDGDTMWQSASAGQSANHHRSGEWSMRPSVISGLSITGGCLSVSYAIMSMIVGWPWYIILYHSLGCAGCVAAYIWASELEE